MERCVVFTKELGNVLERRGACARCIDVVPHGDLSYYRRYYPLTDTRSSCSAERSLLFFGRITPYKGLEILLEAFKPVSQRHSVKLTIAGKGDLRPYRPLLRSQHGVEIINRWIEEHEVAELFGQADMVILPYTSASQSGVLALAAAFELPVVATRVGGMPGQIDAGLTGLLVEPGSVEQLIGAIERLLDDPALAKAMGRSLFLEFSKNRNWSVVAEKVYTICERAIRDASNHPE
jgi:glycosyltransferase involved in cell wall biosynthesis